jgi:hypothetical protein
LQFQRTINSNKEDEGISTTLSKPEFGEEPFALSALVPETDRDKNQTSNNSGW